MNVSLRIVMKNAAVDVFMPKEEAEQIYKRWATRDYAIRGEQILQGQDLYGFSYAVMVAEISALFVMPMPTNAPQPAKAATLSNAWPNVRKDLSGTL